MAAIQDTTSIRRPIYTPVSINDFPCEIIEQICSWIHPRDSNRLQRLSRTLNNMLSSKHFAQLNLSRFICPKQKRVQKTTLTWPDEFESLLFTASNNFAHVVATQLLTRVESISCAHRLMVRSRIPKALGCLRFLKHLDLSSCRLFGEIPAELGNLHNLESLILARNCLSGQLPSEFRTLQNLRILNLMGNKLTGSFPTQICEIKTLEVLDLSGNQMNGPVPYALLELQATLRELNLAGNQFSGKVPVEIGQCFKLEYLYLHSNLLDCSEIAFVLVGLTRLIVRSF
ncbi:hypothetical protein BJ741DRAFT_607784 [Chytriomyces cf. hyalinus JEL632]|nr:hypothetical protein BJ741DRAFT_607784 [Chytriomyces cf. hyalinus JEL632]